MKKKGFSVLIAVCVFGTFPSALNGQCVGEGCGSVPKMIQASVPQCHHTAVPTKEASSPRKECCGKCQIEKAAVLSSDLFPTNDVRHKNTLAQIRAFTGFDSKIRHLSFFYTEYPGSPPGFFEQHVLNTTFSFRAPPQGKCF